MDNEFEGKTKEELMELREQIELQLSVLEIRYSRIEKKIDILKHKEGDDDEWWKKSEQKN